MNYILNKTAKIIMFLHGFKNRICRNILKSRFLRCGKNVKFDSSSRFTFENISIGDDVYIGPGATFSASNSSLIIGSKVLFGPNVTIICGDHNIGELGKYMFDVKIKKPGDDIPVIIEDDVWVGANSIILKGVTISKGTVIAAGSIVTKSTEPYSIYKGAPAKLYKLRWSEEEIRTHEALLKYANDKGSGNEVQKGRPLFKKIFRWYIQ